MKRKVLCFALTVVMGLSMSTCAFAKSTSVLKVGSGDVNGDGQLMADDCAAILQYTLDDRYEGTAVTPFNLNEANYHFDVNEMTNYDLIDAIDSQMLLQDVLNPSTDVYIVVEAGKQNPVTFREVINPVKLDAAAGKTYIEKTKVLDFVDKIFAGDYDTELTNNAGKVNDAINKIEFKGNSGKTASIRSDIGWSKFADAVGGVADKEALDKLGENVKTKTYANAADLKEAYELAKAAFPPRENASATSETAAKVKEITGADVLTVSKLVVDKNGNETAVNTMNFDDICKIVADNNLQKYDDVTIDQLQELFGNKILITAKNTTNGYENQVKVTIERS